MGTKTGIIELNKEAEQYVIQSSRQRSQFNFAELYGDKYVPLEFVHIVVGIDTDCGILKVVRIGADVDRYLRKKTAFCYDYINKKVISEA